MASISWEKISDCAICGDKAEYTVKKHKFLKSSSLTYCKKCVLRRIKDEEVEQDAINWF